MSEQHLSRCIFVIAVLVAIPQLALSGNPVAAAPSAIIVYDHGFAMNVTRARNGNLILINKTSSFTQDDKTVIAFLQAAFYSANLTFNWYSPDGQLYANKTLQLQCATTPCYAAARLFFDWSRTRMPFGRWRLDVLNGGFKLYSDYFYLNSVETQVNDWRFNIESSNSPLVHGELTVTIHPNNGTWSYYRMYIPYANNLTAHEVGSKGNLSVTKTQNDIVVVDLGGPQSAGYSFVIDFNVQYSLQSLNVGGGSFAFAWQDEPWQRFNDPHPIYETFNITLPQGANLVDIVGRNDIALKYDVTAGETQSIGFDTTVISQPFGWTIIYFDSAQVNSHTSQGSPTSGPLNLGAGPLLPLLPLTLGGLNVWSAIMSIFLLTASELASPIYGRSGSRMLINRRRLRIAALLLVVLFVVSTGYQLAFLSPGTIAR